MLSKEDIQGLPRDPELAFIEGVKRLRSIRDETLKDKESGARALRDYINGVHALNDGLGLGVDLKPQTNDDNQFRSWYKQDEQIIDYVMQLWQVERIFADPSDSNEEVEIGENYRSAIHNHLDKIRKIIQSVEIDPRLKESVLKRVNALASAVDKNMHWSTALGMTMMELASVTGESAEKVSPAIDELERVAGALGRAEKDHEVRRLAGPDDTKLLEGPDSESEQDSEGGE